MRKTLAALGISAALAVLCGSPAAALEEGPGPGESWATDSENTAQGGFCVIPWDADGPLDDEFGDGWDFRAVTPRPQNPKKHDKYRDKDTYIVCGHFNHASNVETAG